MLNEREATELMQTRRKLTEDERKELGYYLQFTGAQKRAKAGESPRVVALGYALGTALTKGGTESG